MADLLWLRLKQGKVWHVACGGATVALCEEPLPIRGERQPKRPPFGARPCPSCSVASAQIELAMSDAARAVAEQRAKAVPVEPVAPEPYEHDLTEGRVEAVSLDPTDENPFPGAGEVIVEYGVFGETTPAEYEPDDPQGDDELREQIHEELGKLVAEGVVEFVAGEEGE